jgi:hypothetical protein
MPEPHEHLPYLRHTNGGARIFDNSEICELSSADRLTEVRDDSSVWMSHIRASRIIGSTVSDSTIDSAWIENSEIHRAHIGFSVVAAEFVGCGASVFNSRVTGRSRVVHDAKLSNVRIHDLTVKGRAVLRDWPPDTFDGCQGYISRGVWTRPPRIRRLSFGVTVTESVDGCAFVACREYPISYWFTIGDRIGRSQGWSTAQIDEVRRFLEELVVNPLYPLPSGCVLPDASSSAESPGR